MLAASPAKAAGPVCGLIETTLIVAGRPPPAAAEVELVPEELEQADMPRAAAATTATAGERWPELSAPSPGLHCLTQTGP